MTKANKNIGDIPLKNSWLDRKTFDKTLTNFHCNIVIIVVKNYIIVNGL